TLAFAAVLAGVVRDTGGAAVPGTRIVVRAGAAMGEASTDGRGFYRIEGLPPGDARVDVQPVVLAAPRDAEVRLLPGAVTTHDVTLVAGLTIRGRVRDAATRAGIAGAEVGEGLGGRTVRTDAAGAFELVGFAASHNLSVRVAADGYADTEKHLRGRGSTPEDTQQEVEILLARGHAVTGRVADERGAPLAAVYVAAAAADHQGEHDWFRSDWRSVRSDADGRFRLAALRPDMQHELLLVGAGRASLLLALPQPGPGRGELDVGELRLGPGGSIAGIVTDENGKPVADRELELAGHNADRWRLTGVPPVETYRAVDGYAATRRARTDAAGRFLFADLAAGDYAVRAQKFDSHEQVVVAVTLAAGEAKGGVRLELFAGLAVGGRIVMRDGSAPPKCFCSIDPEDGQATSGDVEVGPDGSFRAAGLLPGSYKITVYPYATDADRAAGRSFQPREFEHVTAGTLALRCELPVFGLVRGEVRRADQSLAAGTCVVLHDGEQALDATAIGPNGQFVLTAITGGRPLRVLVLATLPAPGNAADPASAL
ncbi:MAG: carboxypeptidase-like regulatory domain-containing protein, partial [Planctomycetota bacterium]